MCERWLRFSPSAFTGTRAKCVCHCVSVQRSQRTPDAHLFTKHTCFLAHIERMCVASTCLVFVFMLFVDKCDSNMDTHTRAKKSIFRCVLWLKLLLSSVWHHLWTDGVACLTQGFPQQLFKAGLFHFRIHRRLCPMWEHAQSRTKKAKVSSA